MPVYVLYGADAVAHGVTVDLNDDLVYLRSARLPWVRPLSAKELSYAGLVSAVDTDGTYLASVIIDDQRIVVAHESTSRRGAKLTCYSGAMVH